MTPAELLAELRIARERIDRQVFARYGVCLGCGKTWKPGKVVKHLRCDWHRGLYSQDIDKGDEDASHNNL